MSFVVALPEVLDSAATDLANMGATLNAAYAVAAVPTTGMLAAAEDARRRVSDLGRPSRGVK